MDQLVRNKRFFFFFFFFEKEIKFFFILFTSIEGVRVDRLGKGDGTVLGKVGTARNNWDVVALEDRGKGVSTDQDGGDDNETTGRG